MAIVNLTPHTVFLLDKEGKEVVRTFLPRLDAEGSPFPARCAINEFSLGYMIADGLSIPLTKTEFGAVRDLPEYSPFIMYIVSRLVFDASPDRRDLLVPTEIVRNGDQITGCRSFSVNY